MASGKWHRGNGIDTTKWAMASVVASIQNGIEASELGQTLVLIIPTTRAVVHRLFIADRKVLPAGLELAVADPPPR